MSIVSGFFKLSMMLRNIHTQITEEHGIPYWGSYLLFALATIIIGAVLGLVLVFLIDCFYPAKAAAKRINDKKATASRDKQVDLKLKEFVQQSVFAIDSIYFLFQETDNDDIVDENSESDGKNDDENFSQSEHDSAGSNEVAEGVDDQLSEGEKATSSSPDVRKRRSRKAD